MTEMEEYVTGIVAVRDRERKRIVDWLRECAVLPMMTSMETYRLLFCADAIEHGAHYPERKSVELLRTGLNNGANQP